MCNSRCLLQYQPRASAHRALVRTTVVKQHQQQTRRAAQPCCCSAAGSPTLALHIGETVVAFPLSRQRGQELQSAVKALLQTFAEKQKAERPKRYKSMEYRLTGAPEDQGLKQLEVFCNPNAATNAFTAKVLVSFQSKEGVRVTTEGPLSNFKADVDTYLESL
ncbi:hypothetical protein WJX73_000760 [Symbiochloris irregularis]|uniref:Uncharacterized protein n=1 Tax=Symbiochloris irregularis TaxID=706552 RepID=A0AAW1PYC8_9CHLO